MKKITLLISIISSINLFALEGKDKKFTFTPFGQYGSSYYYLKGKDLGYFESPLNTYGYGIRVSYNIKKIAITSGIEYQQYGEQAKFEGLTFGDQIDPAIGFTIASQESINAVTYKYKYNYLTVPLVIEKITNLKIKGKSFNMTFLAGAKTNIYASSSKTIIYGYQNGEQSKNKQNYNFDNRSVNLISVYSILFHKKLGEQIALKIGPTFDLFHQNRTNSTPVERIPYKGSIFAGITF